MIGNKTKEFKFWKIINKENLDSLNDFITKNYKNVNYIIHTKDKISFELEKYDELISYENYNKSRIVWIKINANIDEFNNYFYSPDLRIFIGGYIIEYEIKKSSEKDIIYLSEKIEKLIYNFKSPYNWVNTFWGSWLINSILISLIILMSFKKIKGIESSIETPWNYILLYSVIIILGQIFELIKNYLYPKSCFMIGAQIKKFEKKKKLRKTIIGILFTIFLGIATNYIYQKLFYPY